MSSGQEGDVPSKGNKTEGDLLVTCVDEPIPKMETEDQTDHAISLTPKKLDQLEGPDSATSKTDTDSGFKDPGTDPKATTVVNADSSGDEDMHLKWEDDEADDLGVTSGDIPEKSITKYGTEEIKVEELEESLDENLLLESSDEMDKTDDTSNKDEGTANEDEIDKLLVSDDNKQAIETLNTNNDSEKTDLIGVSVQPDLLSKNNEETIKNLQMSIAESTQEKSVVSIKDITLLDAKDESIIDDAIVTASSPNESLSNTTIDAKLDHKLNNPDVMLEIPTQEIIDLMDDTDMSLSCTNDDDDIEKTVDDVAESPKAMDVSDEPEETIQSADTKTNDISTVLDSEVSKVDTMIGENKEPCGDLASVSEDDWTQIENRLAKFETSLVDESKEDIESNDEKNSKYISSTEKSSTVNDDSANMDGAISTLASQNIDEQSPNPKSTNVGTTIEPHSNTESKALEKSTTEISAETENTPESPKPSQEALITDVEVSETKLEQSQPLKDLSAIEGIGDTTTNSDKTEIATNITESKGEIKKNMPTNEDTFPPKEEIISTPSISQITELPITVTSPEDTKNNDTSLSESCKEIDDHPSKDTTNEPIKESLSMDVDNVIQSQENANKVQLLDETSSEGNVTAKPTTLVESDKKSLKGTTAPDSELVPDIIKTVNNIEDTTPLQPTKLETLTASKEVTIDNSTLNVQLSETVIDVDSIPDSQDMADDLLAKIISSDQIKVMPKSLEEKNNSTIETTEDGLKQDTARVVNADEIITSTEMLKEILEQSKLTSRSGPSHQASDSSDEVAEITDSLGLLAESSRVMEDDEEQEDDEDDDDDFYHEDESSNQMTAEHSEDSNQQTSETEVQKEQEEKEMETESPTDEKEQGKFSFDVDENIKVEDGETERIFKVDIDTTEIVLAETKEEVKITVKKGITPDEEVKSEQRLQEVETVKLSDVSETDASAPSAASDTPSDGSTLKKLLCDAKAETVTVPAKPSPILKLALSKQDKVLNFVDLEESSEDDEVLVVKKIVKLADATEGTLADGEGPSEAPPAHNKDKTTQLSEDIAAETTTHNDSPSTSKTPGSENKFAEETKKPKQKFGLEIFNLDSDEEDSAIQPEKPAKGGEVVTPAEVEEPQKADKARAQNRCINVHCTGESETYSAPDAAAVTYYDAAKKRRAMVCERCALVVADRTRTLIEGIKDLTPLLSLEIGKVSSEVVEISDSDPEDEVEDSGVPEERVGESGAKFLEAELAKAINETWMKFKMDSRLTDAEDVLNKEMKMLEEQTKEIDAMLDECQAATDQLRNELYATFEQERHELNSLVIFDTPTNKYTCLESAMQQKENTSSPPGTRSKRRISSATESASKRPAIPLGYAPLDADKNTLNQDVKSEPTVETLKTDDDKELTVLKVSVEAPPADLPPLGELARPPLRADAYVFVMRNTFGSWARGKILEVQGKGVFAGTNQNFTICRVKVFSRNQCKTKLVPARCLAYNEPAEVRLTIGTRVIAVFIDPMNLIKRETYYSGIVAEMPNPVNGYRYLVFFDDGYAQYVRHKDTRLVCECSPLVWEEVHPFSREFVRKYLIAYPERPMVRLHAGQSLKTEWNGKWWPSRVIQVDASLVHVHFEEDDRTEWIYRGSTRLAPLYLELQAAERQRTRPMPRTKAQARVNMPYVEYTRSDEQSKSEPAPPPVITAHEREIRQRAVAKKSTTAPPPADTAPAADPAPASDGVSSRVVYYTPKTAIKPLKMVQHTCGPKCKRSDTYSLKELRTYNPLAKPLLSGWERQIVRYNGHKEVMYRAPCGRRLRNIWELHRYLRAVHSEMAVDLFDFTPHTHCLAEFVLNKCLVGKKDLSYGKENVPVPCVNYYDESMPEFCSYNTERTPTAGVPLNLDPEFLCGCDCTDDCEDKSKCACWKMTLEGARTIGLRGKNIGYVYKRLPEPLPSGIYECNSRCKCKKTCLNRVAQHPLQLKLQVFKTLNRGWGIRALNDVPKGSFLCVYAGNLLTDATANMDGLNEGDEYLAELDYIEVVEQMKEGYEEDIPEADKRLDKVTNEEPESSSEEEEPPSKDEKEDDDFCPGHIGMGVAEFSKRLRKRDKNKKEKEEADVKVKTEVKKEGEKTEEDCITISDDEEVREPSRFMAQAGMESSEFISKHRSVRSYFGKDEACYIMDAKVQGNIGRYLNHSCMPNVFVQNVFVDTHDPRFPWVAFFALSHIKAGTELTWNYNYDVGSVPGKSLYCYCGAPNCRGRLL